MPSRDSLQWSIPSDEVTAGLRQLKADLRHHTFGYARILTRRQDPSPGNPAARDGDFETIAIRPFSVGAVTFGWHQEVDLLLFSAAGTHFETMPRTTDTVAVIRQAAEAVVLGHVEWSPREWGFNAVKLRLADGTILQDNARATAWYPDGTWKHQTPPLGWRWASPYVERQALLQRVVTATTSLVARRATRHEKPQDAVGREGPDSPASDVDPDLDAAVSAYARARIEHARKWPEDRLSIRARTHLAVYTVRAERSRELAERVEQLVEQAESISDPGGPSWRYGEALRAWALTHPEVDVSPLLGWLLSGRA
jgi:hypothetical protein